MIKVSIINELDGRQFFSKFESIELANKWIEKKSNSEPFSWGKPERNVLVEDATDLEKSRELRVEIIDKVPFIVVKSDFKVTIIDEEKDDNYFNELQKQRRAKEHPSWNKVNEAIIENMEGRPELLEQVIQEREIVRNKYPYRR